MNSQPSIGYISLLLVVFGRQLCLPLPADLLLVAAGALVAGGRMSLPLVLCIGVSGCLAGDLVWFGAGRRWGSKVLHILCNFHRRSGAMYAEISHFLRTVGPETTTHCKIYSGDGRHTATHSRDGRFSFTKFRCVRCSRFIALVRILRRTWVLLFARTYDRNQGRVALRHCHRIADWVPSGNHGDVANYKIVPHDPQTSSSHH